MRQRICEAHVEAHGRLRERVLRAKARGQAASFDGLAAELRAVAAARRYAAQGHGPARAARMVEVRNALLDVAVSAILLAEAADRPELELVRGEKSTAKQWLTPDFRLPEIEERPAA
ncbi:MAG TPA: hypothetical protein VFT50_09435 [Baekduia sp.]|nr:hypothetical protein [Baekduia sp.]